MRVAITGAATGIGAEVASRLKTGGHEVHAFDISQPTDNTDVWIKTDMSDAVSIDAALAAADGPFDALINNAGLPPREGLTEAILQVNYLGLKRFLDGMLSKLSAGASIVNTASRAGAMWRDNLDQVKAFMALDDNGLAEFITKNNIDPTRAYNLSKEALIVMTMAATKEMVSRDLRMNTVSPAAVSTDILQDFAAAFGDRMTKNVARAGRPGTAAEIADVIVFMSGPQSAWIKGQDIVIDGGMSAMAMSDALEINSV